VHTACGVVVDEQSPILEEVHGVWVPELYFNCLEDRDCSECYEHLEGISSILINEEIKSVGISLNNHEGEIGSLTLDNDTSIKLNVSESIYSLRLVEGVLEVQDISGLVRRYVRVFKEFSSDVDAGFAVDFLAREKIFKGEYQLLINNSLEKGSVVFTSEGEVEGFLDYSKFKVTTDYSMGVDNSNYVVFSGSVGKLVLRYERTDLGLVLESVNSDVDKSSFELQKKR
jgi:hypothetical protein